MVYLSTGLEDPVSPSSVSCLMSPIQGERGRAMKAWWGCGWGNVPCRQVAQGGDFRASRVTSATLWKGKERPINRITTRASKQSQASSWAEQQQRWGDVEKLMQFKWLTWSRVSYCPQKRRTVAVLDQPRSCRSGRSSMSFPSCSSDRLNAGGRSGCSLSGSTPNLPLVHPCWNPALAEQGTSISKWTENMAKTKEVNVLQMMDVCTSASFPLRSIKSNQ